MIKSHSSRRYVWIYLHSTDVLRADGWNVDGKDIHRQAKKYDGRGLIGPPSYNGSMISNVGSYG